MSRLALAASVALLLAAASAQAASPDPTTLRLRGEVAPPEVTVSAGDISATPEMWFYEQQLRRHDDPSQAVRRKAELRGQQRQARLAALKWFGYSNSRPRAAADPYNGDASPAWASNNSWYPFRWCGNGPASVSVPVTD